MTQRSHHSSSHPTSGPSMPSAASASSPYCYGHSSQGALFCGLRKSLREILRSKHSSPMYSVKPMMYSQRDMFFSPRSRRNEEEDEGPSSSMWEGFQSSQHDPKAHLHFNSAVRQAVEKHSDVLTGLKCHHMEDIIAEVMRLCPLLRNDVIVRKKVSGAIKSYICNAVTHYKRKQRKNQNNPDQSTKTSATATRRPPDTIKTTPASDEEVGLFQDSPSSYQDDLIDYSASVVDEGVSLEVTSINSQPEAVGVMLVPSHIPSPRLRHTLSGTRPRESIPVTARPTESRQHSVMRPQSEVAASRSRSQLIEISDVRSITMETDCVASSVDRGELEFRFSDGPTMEELRAVQADFAKQRDWDQFHQPRNLLLAMIGEIGEVSELFQWRGECKEGLEDWSEKDKKHLGQELSDVLMYLIRLAEKCHVDLPQAAMEKIGLNAKKYPAHKVHGSSKKYTEYE